MGLLSKHIDKFASQMAFFPPDPPSYVVAQRVKEGEECLAIISSEEEDSQPVVCDVFRLTTRQNTEIVAAYIPTKQYTDAVILYSHGNAVDLGQMLPFFKELSRELKCNVMSYDYSGYGRSSGKPSVSNSLNDIKACLEWLYQAGKEPGDVILYGQSIGSGPSVSLASKNKNLGGMVLVSPLASGMQVIKSNWSWWPSALDVFPNTALMPNVECPVLIMHGKKDDVIPVSHGQKLHALAKNAAEPLWDEKCGHSDMECSKQFLPRLKKFVETVLTKRSKNSGR